MFQANYFERWVLEPARFLAERFREELDNLRGGGPPTPMHPVPASDLVISKKMPPYEPAAKKRRG